MEGCTLQEVVGAVSYSRDSNHLLTEAAVRREGRASAEVYYNYEIQTVIHA